MPTLNPRINVTVSVSLDLLVSRMAVHTRASKSQVLRELLEAAEPALQRAVVLMDAATTATAEARSGLARQMDRGQDQAEDALAVILSRLDRATGDLVSQAEQVQGKRPARRSPASAERPSAAAARTRLVQNPPASNRGVKSPPNRKTKGKPEESQKRRRSS